MNKTFGIGKKIRENLFTEKERIYAPLQVDPYFIKLKDVFKSYASKSGLVLIVNESETGIDVTEVVQLNDKYYVHFQLNADTEWIVEHNLDKYPYVSILNDNEKEINGEVLFLDTNTLLVKIEVALTGIVCVN